MIRDNPNTDPAPDTHYLHYTGEDHVGRSAAPRATTSSSPAIGDDTLWGDGGNDRLDGGYGNDNIRGGAGDDIITDMGGDDNIQGGDGNDVIQGGNGANLILGGFGNDFIITGEDNSEAFGGAGDDFILGNKSNEQDIGNEGDDWIEKGTSDGAPGDNFDPLGNDPIIGNDIFIGDGENDKFIGEGGDDIMVGSIGLTDRYFGGSGFDWADLQRRHDRRHHRLQRPLLRSAAGAGLGCLRARALRHHGRPVRFVARRLPGRRRRRRPRRRRGRRGGRTAARSPTSR